ncbi:MAG: class I SAM-dependent methyltransferase, partial [Nitrospira sp.]|nr:class I SAM-dependent methyltransferase [Nitrospira sp.]
MDNPFEVVAGQYDAWFDTPEGRAIFQAELECLRPLVTKAYRPWLEIGVGTGRFAQALGVEDGIDPSASMMKKASARRIRVLEGLGESLPYKNHSFGGILMVVTVCFLSRPEKVLAEAARVLRPRGRLVVGIIPADSPWGGEYARKGKEGHPLYSVAKFYKSNEVIAMAQDARFQFEEARSGLFTRPGAPVEQGPP